MITAMHLTHTGRVWKFGDQINTDLIMPATSFRMSEKERAKMAFSAIRPGWAGRRRRSIVGTG